MMNRKNCILFALIPLVVAMVACTISGQLGIEGNATATPAATATTEPTLTPPPSTEAPTDEPPATEDTAQPPSDGHGGTEEEETPPAKPPEGQSPLEAANVPELTVPTINPQPGQGMGHLETFRQRMRLDFTAEESDYSGTFTYEGEVNTEDQALHAALSAEGAAAQQLPAASVEGLWIGDRLWVKIGNQPWFPVPQNLEELPFDEQMLAIGNFLPYVAQFERVGEETVNGIPSVHYTYDVTNVPTQYGQVSGLGDLYVATDGGYVVRYTFDGSGTFEEYFTGSGTFQIVYDTYDVGAEITIRPPRG